PLTRSNTVTVASWSSCGRIVCSTTTTESGPPPSATVAPDVANVTVTLGGSPLPPPAHDANTRLAVVIARRHLAMQLFACICRFSRAGWRDGRPRAHEGGTPCVDPAPEEPIGARQAGSESELESFSRCCAGTGAVKGPAKLERHGRRPVGSKRDHQALHRRGLHRPHH